MRIEFHPKALREFERIARQHQRRILKFLRERFQPLEDPRSLGEPLRGPLQQLWKYRVGDCRLSCDIQDEVITILVLRSGHRCEIYRR